LIYRNRTVSTQELKRLIIYLAETGHPSIERVAERLGASVRSLQRDLQLRGITYSDLVDCARYECAQALLCKSSSGISDISAMLGYTDPSSFSRAFMRWSGVSPRQYRRMKRQCAGEAK
jgi:AraC-like DNA-binding protein